MTGVEDPAEYRERVCRRVRALLDARGLALAPEHIARATERAVEAIPNPARHPRPDLSPDEVRAAQPAAPLRVLGVKGRGRWS